MSTPGRRRRRAAVAGASLAALLLALVPAGAAAAAGPRPAASQPAQPSGQVDWPKFHFDAGNGGVSPETLLSAANLPQLGVAWMDYTGGASEVSPVVAYDAHLDRTLVYIANYNGDVFAYDAASGGLVWATRLGVATVSSPLVIYPGGDVDGTLWEGTFGGIFALDASTGAIQCTDVALPGAVQASPTEGVVGGSSEVYFSVLDSETANGAVIAFDPSCVSGQAHVIWSFNGFGPPGGTSKYGTWSPPSFGTDRNGRPLVFTGTAETDSAVYAIDATNGTLVWRFQTPSNGVVDDDVGAGTTVSAPGVNGFADGVLYAPAKDGDVFALDLTTGAQIWAFPYKTASKSRGGGISTAALAGASLYFGYGAGLYDINAVTGVPIWKTQDMGLTTAGVDASPAVSGPSGSKVVLVADKSGVVRGFSAASGQQLWSYTTAGPVYSSPAISGGSVYIASNDGFLYDFTPGGAAGPTPTTAVTYPSLGAQLANPNGVLTISGSASGSTPLQQVLVGIEEYGPGGPWWRSGTQSWAATPAFEAATLATPGADSSAWQYGFAVPATGGVFVLVAYAVLQDGLADPRPRHVPFAVFASTAGAQLSVSPAVPPAGKLTATGHGFAPGTAVSIALDATTLFTRTSDSHGNLAAFTVKIPGRELPGPHSLWASDGAGDKTQAIVNVTTPWLEWRDRPLGTGAATHIQPLSEGDLWEVLGAWSTGTGGAVESSPAVANGTAYIGSDDGKVYALNVTDGTVRWTFTTGGAVKSSPAVTPSSVIFGSEDGHVRAVDPALGTLQWAVDLGTPIDSSPVVSGTTAYIGGSDGGVRALRTSNGSVLWTTMTGGAVSSSAAVDAGRVYIGSGDATVYALDAATGAVDWHYTTGGAVSATPAVDAGSVFVGSADGRLYALNESTGTVTWSYATAGAVSSSAAVGSGMVFFGSADGNLYGLQETGGAQVWHLHTGGAVTSSPVFAGSFVAVGSADGKVYATRSGYGWPVTKFTTGGPVTGSVSISDGAIYVGSGDGHVYAYSLFGSPPIIP